MSRGRNVSESLKPTCVRLVFAVLEDDYIMIEEQRVKIEDFFDINPQTPEDDELTEILSTLEEKENIHLPISTWGYTSQDYLTHLDRTMDYEELAEKYGNKLAKLIWKRFGIPRIS